MRAAHHSSAWIVTAFASSSADDEGTDAVADHGTETPPGSELSPRAAIDRARGLDVAETFCRLAHSAGETQSLSARVHAVAAGLLLAEGDDAEALALAFFPDADAHGDAGADADTLGAAVALTLGSDVAPMPRSVASSRLSSATWAPRASAASRRWFVSWLAALIATTR